MPFAPMEGGQIHYRLYGKQELPALVLSNSLGTDLSMWDAQVPAFAEHFRVLRYDSYGHGASTFAAGGFRIDRLGQDVVRLLDHLGITNFSFCGLSVGGLVGQWLGLNAAKRLEDLASGPGKLTLALGITRQQNGADLTRSALQVRGLRDEPAIEVAVTPRVGITHCADWPLRFFIAGNRFVSR